MPTITSITAREILNGKGNPTIETTLLLSNGLHATVSCPSGTSVSAYEAIDLRDGDMNHFNGLGVLKAIKNITDVVAPELVGKSLPSQKDVDSLLCKLDGTPNKKHLGGNATLSVSLVVAKTAAVLEDVPLYRHISALAKIPSLKIPTPIFNMINGGMHAKGTFDLQEFIVVPASSKTYSQSLQMGFRVYKSLQNILVQNNLSTLIGDEGGFSPALHGNKEALHILKNAIEESGYRLGFDCFLGVDAAATSFYKNEKYVLKEKTLSQSIMQMMSYYKSLVDEFDLFYLEDLFAEDDWAGWIDASAAFAKHAMVVGDDLISTNPSRLKIAIEKKVISAVIIKPNQIGTISETLDVVSQAQKAGLKIIVSHRSGETNDDFIADFAVGIGAHYCKFGAPVRGERVAKYNRLLQIEKEMKL